MSDNISENLGTIMSGTTVYNRQKHQNHEYAVLEGKTLEDTAFVYAIKHDKSSGDNYYIHMQTREKSWNLPEVIQQAEMLVPPEVLNNPWRSRFIAFYEKYSPDRIPFIDPTLIQHPGREAILMKALVRKYGPEPGHEDEYEGAMNEVADRREASQSQRDVGAFRERVIAIIRHYKPSKLGLVDKYMEKYAGQEEELIQFLINKFGPEPLPGEISTTEVYQTVPAADTSMVEKQVYLRESALMGFLQDREARLEAALNRNVDLTVELNSLREQNEGLLTESRELRALVDSESKRIEGELARAQNANIIAAQSWEVEKVSLLAQMQSEASNSHQLLTTERIRYQKASADHSKEKGALLEELQKNKEELDFCQRKTSELLQSLDKKEIALLKLQKEHELAINNMSALRVNASTQTSGEDLGLSGPFALQTPEQQDATNALQNRIQQLELIIRRIKFDVQQHSYVSQQLQSKASNLENLTSPLQKSPHSVQEKLYTAQASISALKAMNKSYEERIAMLEMRLLSQPPTPAVHAADGETEEYASIRERLAFSEATVRTQKKEITDLRGLLARYMSVQKKKVSPI